MDGKPLDVNKNSACSSAENQPPSTEEHQKFVVALQFTTKNDVFYKQKDNISPTSSTNAGASCNYDYPVVQESFTESNDKSTFSSSSTEPQPLFTEKHEESGEALQFTTKRSATYYEEDKISCKPSTFICEYCSKCFTNRAIYKAHIRCHTGEKPFGCQYCSKRFGMKEHLKLHTRVHTGERPFQCEYCDKSFVNTSNLKVHTRTHTGEKPYKCPICGWEYTSKKNLDRHQKANHPEKTK